MATTKTGTAPAYTYVSRKALSIPDPERPSTANVVIGYGYVLAPTSWPEYVEASSDRFGVSKFANFTDPMQIENFGSVVWSAGTLDDPQHDAIRLELQAKSDAEEEADLQAHILAASREKGGLARLRAHARQDYIDRLAELGVREGDNVYRNHSVEV